MRITYGDRWAHNVKRIMLDGVVQTLVIMADEEAGVIERYVNDEKGNPKTYNDGFVTETLRGKVVIVMDAEYHKRHA